MAHYAHDVQYEAENFLDKNKDTVPDEHMTLLQGSEFEFLKEVMDRAAANNPAPTVKITLFLLSRKGVKKESENIRMDGY